MTTSLGMFLRKLRLDHGEKLKTMAERLGVSSVEKFKLNKNRKWQKENAGWME